MLAPDPSARDARESGARTRRSPGLRIARAIVAALLALALGAGLAAAGGFLWFVHSVPTEEIALEREADGIVALTGGTARVSDAIELLASGRGRRLLITGVHKDTSARELARLSPHRETLIACCVDLDYSAVNTVGNAEGARRWAKDRNFRSLIVVTSSYHMPRSMAELSHQLPDVALIPFPVVTDKLRADSWWSHLPTARILLSEYLKYMVAQMRMRLEPAPSSTDVARARDHDRS